MHHLFEKARENMVEGQVRPNKVTHPGLLDAMRFVPRERFVPRHLQHIAYVDEDIPLGNGRYLPEPMVLARLVQAAEIRAEDVVLDIGCGTGYSAAILGQLAATVVGLEQNAQMTAEADRLLHELGVVNAVVIQQEDLRQGYAQQEPYDVIVINGSVPHVPETILHQLSDGGRLVTVQSKKGHLGQAVLMTRKGNAFETRILFDAAVPTLSGFEIPQFFVF